MDTAQSAATVESGLQVVGIGEDDDLIYILLRGADGTAARVEVEEIFRAVALLEADHILPDIPTSLWTAMSGLRQVEPLPAVAPYTDDGSRIHRVKARQDLMPVAVSRDAFECHMGRRWPWLRRRADGSLGYFGLCPECDCPIELVGLYDDPDPYGTHVLQNLKGLGEDNPERRMRCRHHTERRPYWRLTRSAI